MSVIQSAVSDNTVIQGLTDDDARTTSQRDVMFVISALGIGGSERKIVRIATALAASGTRVSMCVLGRPYTLLPHLQDHIPVTTLDRTHRLSRRTMQQLARQIRAQGPATVIAVDLFALLYAAMALRSSGSSARRVALINTTTFVRRRDRLFMLGYAPLLRGSDLLVFGSTRQREQWTGAYRLGGTPACVIHNGVDLARFAPGIAARGATRDAFGFAPGEMVIGSVGRLAPEKNQVAIVRAAAQLRRSGAEVRVLLAGDGPMREEIVSEAGRLGIEERVMLAGEVTDVRPLLAAMDVFVLPSTSVETFSNAALEAMAMSLPVVLSDIGGAREMVAEGTEGFIIPPGDDAALRHALEQFSCDPARRQRMAAAARARVEREFSFGRMVEAYRALIAPAGDRDATVAGGSLSSA